MLPIFRESEKTEQIRVVTDSVFIILTIRFGGIKYLLI